MTGVGAWWSVLAVSVQLTTCEGQAAAPQPSRRTESYLNPSGEEREERARPWLSTRPLFIHHKPVQNISQRAGHTSEGVRKRKNSQDPVQFVFDFGNLLSQARPSYMRLSWAWHRSFTSKLQ